MKKSLLKVVFGLALIIAGASLNPISAEAVVFSNPGSTGCSAPVGGSSVGDCGHTISKSTVATPAPATKHWKRHGHFRPHHHFKVHHFKPRHHHFRSHHRFRFHGHHVRSHHAHVRNHGHHGGRHH